MSQPIAYDLEYRDREDGAWYSIAVELADDGETLKLLPDCLGSSWKPRFRARDFKSADEVDEFLARFRPVSLPLQDSECQKVTAGMTVCASLSSPQKTDLRFYDATVEGVQHVEHGEEECLCSFLLCWKHGKNTGCITAGRVADICLIQSAAVVHSQIEAFRYLTKEKVLAAHPMSSRRHGSIVCVGERTLFKSTSQDVDLGKDLSLDSNFCDMVEDAGASDPEMSGPSYFVIVDNLDQNLSTAAMSRFLLQHTLVSPRVYLYPSRSSVPFRSAAIATDSREDIEKIYAFLVDLDHLIVSSEGRPWVVHEKVFDEPCVGLLSQSQDVFQGMQEFQLVHSGTEAYDTASRVRDMFLEFLHHEERIYANLAIEQEQILKSFPSGNRP